MHFEYVFTSDLKYIIAYHVIGYTTQSLILNFKYPKTSENNFLLYWLESNIRSDHEPEWPHRSRPLWAACQRYQSYYISHTVWVKKYTQDSHVTIFLFIKLN